MPNQVHCIKLILCLLDPEFFKKKSFYRLDFEEFELDGGSDVDKPCDRDFIEIFSGEVMVNL